MEEILVYVQIEGKLAYKTILKPKLQVQKIFDSFVLILDMTLTSWEIEIL